MLRRPPAATPRRLCLLAILAAAVFSHFVLDVPMHTADMPLGPGPGSPKIGLGLWNHRAASIAAASRGSDPLRQMPSI